MTREHPDRISVLRLELEEAVQLLRLVVSGKKTPTEIKEWLDLNYPEDTNNESEIFDFFGNDNGSK